MILTDGERKCARNLLGGVIIHAFRFADVHFGHVVLALRRIQEGEHHGIGVERHAIDGAGEDNVVVFGRFLLGLRGIGAVADEIALHIYHRILGLVERIGDAQQFVGGVRRFFCAIAGKSGGEGAQAQREGEKSTGKMLHKR